MKAREWIGLSIFSVMIVGAASAARAQTSTDVYTVSILLKGRVRNDTTPPFSKVITGTTDDLINLAQGNDPKTAVPPNVILAILAPAGGGDARLAVFDTSTGSELVVIGTFEGPSVRTSPTKKVGTFLLPIENVGNPSFGLTGGDLMLDAILVQPQGQATVRANGGVTGWLDLTITDDTGTHAGSVPFPNGKISATYLSTVALP